MVAADSRSEPPRETPFPPNDLNEDFFSSFLELLGAPPIVDV